MSIILSNSMSQTYIKVISRAFSCSQSLTGKQWRLSKGRPSNLNTEAVLLDGPDYTYLDGRPTPLLHKQKLRMTKQREFANTIVGLCSELDFAKERYQNMIKAEEAKREKIITSRLKPKGRALYKK